MELQACDLWSNTLSDVERGCAPIVYKLLEFELVHEIFGRDPWRSGLLPDRYINDAKAFIAFTKVERFNFHFGPRSYDVPQQFRDNFDAMKAMCSVSSSTLCIASDRLRDNEDIVLAAFSGGRYSSASTDSIQYASVRLKANKQFISKCFVTCASKWKEYTTKIEFAKYAWLFHGGILNGMNFSVDDMRDFLNLLPPNDAGSAAIHFPATYFDDEIAVMELIKRLDSVQAEAIFRQCSKRVRSIKEVSKQIVQDIEEEDNEVDYDVMIEDILSQVQSKEITSFGAIPAWLRMDRDILSKALECGMLDSKDAILDFASGIKDDKDEGGNIWQRWEICCDDFKLYSMLPEDVQSDEDVAIALLEAGYNDYHSVLEKIPSLCQSKRAIKALLLINQYDFGYREYDLDEFIQDSPFLGDKELMILAANTNDNNLDLVEDHLFEDRDFVENIKSPWTISYSSDEFQMNNLDLVKKAIHKLDDFNTGDAEVWFDNIASEVWRDCSVIMAWLTRERDDRNQNEPGLLELLRRKDDANPFLGDEDIVSLSVKRRASDFQYASEELRSDDKFVLQLVRKTGRILHYVSRKSNCVSEDDAKILIAAISKCEGVLVDCFNVLKSSEDNVFLAALSAQIKEKLHLHKVFMDVFLCGVSMVDQHIIHPSLRSPLPMLNQGAETSTNLKKLISTYAGVPVGISYVEAKAAASSLERFGF